MEAAKAVSQIGTNALPWLLKWTPCENRWPRDDGWNQPYGPSLRFRIYESVLRRFPRGRLQTSIASLGEKLLKPRSEVNAEAAIYGVRILGARAAPLIPVLTRLMQDTNAPLTASRSKMMLACIGDKGLPALLSVITNRAAFQREYAVAWVAEFLSATNLLPAVPFFVQWVKDDPAAQFALDRLARERPEIAFLILTNDTCRANQDLLWHAISTIGRYATNRNAIPWLIMALRGRGSGGLDYMVRQSSVDALRRIDPTVLAELPPVKPWTIPSLERWMALGQEVHPCSLPGPALNEWMAESVGKQEPQYEGQTLSLWLRGVTDSIAPSNNVSVLTLERKRCKMAVQAIGTNALPWLIRWLKSKNVEGTFLSRRGFGMLQKKALLAAPALLEMANSNDQRVRGRAYSCLACLHLDWTNTWAALLPAVHNSDLSIRTDAAGYLWENFPKEAEAAGLKDFVPP